jgi:hypothetical protein
VARGPLEEAGGVEEAVEPRGRVAEERDFLLEEDVDAAEKNGDAVGAGERGFVEHQREIHRRDGDVVAGALEFLREGVVAHAGSAVVAPGAGGEEDDFHAAWWRSARQVARQCGFARRCSFAGGEIACKQAPTEGGQTLIWTAGRRGGRRRCLCPRR